MSFDKRKSPKIKVKQKNDNINSDENIKMFRRVSPSRKPHADDEKKPAPKREIRVIKGNGGKYNKIRRSSFVFVLVALLAVVAIVVVNIALPTGLVEWSQNRFTLWSRGEGLPVAIGGDGIYDMQTRRGEVFVMSDSYMLVYNQSGKQVTSVQHGYNSPKLEISSERSLIYDRGSFGLRIDTLYANLYDTQLSDKIITADICQSGHFAVATDSSDYSATVTVYDKNFKSVFRWSAASGQISCVKLSPDGKSIAIASVDSFNGDYRTVINIFETSNGNKILSKEIDGTVYLKSTANKHYVCFVGIDSFVSLKWDGTDVKVSDYYGLDLVNTSDDDNIVLAYHPNGDDRQSTVTVIGKNGEQKHTLVIGGTIGKICADQQSIYTYYNGIINKYSVDGKLVDTFNTGCEYVYIEAYKNGVIATHDMKLEKYS